MRIMQKIAAKAKDNMNADNVVIAFLGDSVTQGCFELYKKKDNSIETVFDKENAYHAHLNRILSVLYPGVPVNVINAGISGDSAPHGLERLERDVLRHAPDLVVVCFGLNDSVSGIENVGRYAAALRGIFLTLKDKGIEVIFMTPNMMNTEISVHLQDEDVKRVAGDTLKTQLGGTLDTYISEAKKVCGEFGVPVCDCYEKWKLLYKNGVEVTELLANKINHPTRQMNWLFAVSLLETMMQE